jgi:hypothetical protein
MTMTNAHDVLAEWYQRVWSDEDPSAIDDILPESTEVAGLGAHPLAGPKDFKVFQSALLKLLKDMRIVIDKTIYDPETSWTSQMITVHGVCKKTDTPVSCTGQVTVRVEDGKIVEGYNAIDFITLFGQLGLLPQDSFAACLAGKRVG